MYSQGHVGVHRGVHAHVHAPVHVGVAEARPRTKRGGSDEAAPGATTPPQQTTGSAMQTQCVRVCVRVRVRVRVRVCVCVCGGHLGFLQRDSLPRGQRDGGLVASTRNQEH